MKAMVAREWGKPFKLETVPDPIPKVGEAVMRVRSAGAGLTILNMRSGAHGGSLPRIMGNELGGDIVAVGPGVSNVKTGDRCTVFFYLTCAVCRWCRGGRETLCENFGGFVGVHRDGGYAEYVCLPAENFLPIPDELSYEAAAIAADAVNTNWHCMRERARIVPGENVVLIGAGGGLGIHGVQMAKVFGAYVVAIDVGEEKLALATQWGADAVLDAGAESDLASRIRALTEGRGAEVAIDYVGRPETFGIAVDALNRAGRAVVVGAAPGKLSLPVIDLLLTEKIITGSRHSNRRELIESLDLMARGKIKPVIGRRAHFTEVEGVLQEIRDGKVLGRASLVYE